MIEYIHVGLDFSPSPEQGNYGVSPNPLVPENVSIILSESAEIDHRVGIVQSMDFEVADCTCSILHNWIHSVG